MHEIKADSVIEKNLTAKHPSWKKDINENIHYLPAEEYYADRNIEYKIRPISSFNKKLLANQKLLLASRREKEPTEKFIKKVRKLLTKNFSMTMEEIMENLCIVDATPLIQLVDQGVIFCELENEYLSDYQNIHLALTRELSIHSRSLRVQNKMNLDMLDIEITNLPAKKYADEALKKLEAIKNGRKGRSVRRWIQKIKEGEKYGLSPFEALLSKKHRSGNRSERFLPEVKVIFEKSIEQYYAMPTRPNIKSAYVRYKCLSRESLPDDDPISEKTFRNWIQKMDPMQIAYKRGGKRMSNSKSPTSEVEKRIPKAKIAFERAHIDHHIIKCFLVWGSDGNVEFIGRPWLTLLIDEATDMVLGYHISFSQPSRLADGCVLRDCLRRYGKLPDEIVADHGSDFKSVYFRSLLASKKITLTLRPKSQAKTGSEVEGFFNEFQVQWLCQREGNMVNKYAVRAVDGKFSSKRHAVFRPEDFLGEFDQFVAYRNNKLRGSKTVTAESSFKFSLQTFSCVGRKIAYDKEFIVASAVESNEYTIERNDIKIDGIRYSHPKLRNTKLLKSKVEVRVEPENPYVVYASVNNCWISCAATGVVEFMEKSNMHQRVETLKIRGAGSFRQLGQSHAQVQLGNLLNEADERLDEKRKFGWIDYDNKDELEAETEDINPNIFDQLANIELHELSTSEWSQL